MVKVNKHQANEKENKLLNDLPKFNVMDALKNRNGEERDWAKGGTTS